MSSQKQYAVNRKEIVMKKFRRIATMLLALSLALSIVVIPAAAADNQVPDEDPWVAALLAADDCEIRYTEDGSARIITATLDEDEMPAQTRSMNPYDESGTTFWNDNSEVFFQCEDGWGKTCRVATYNTDEENNIDVTYSYVINGTPISTSDTMEPEGRYVAVIESTNGEDLTCSVDVLLKPTINPAGTGDGLSAEWYLEAEQY